MKINAEIKDNKFIFEYEIGTSKNKSTSTICPDSLIAFTEILRQMSHISTFENKEAIDEIKARVWINKNKDKALNYLKEEDK